jgi:tRNA dimethylallyltransferase
MVNKLLVICGGTGTGKTSLGIKLARRFNGEIVSADSRQVYRGMDIGTGKDWSEDKSIQIWGYDIADPKKAFSVSQYVKAIKPMISDIQRRGKLPILVGGTGLYIKALIEGFDTLNVPKNERLRSLLKKLTAGELYEKLCELDTVRGASMNLSDRQNPRRLMRAVEVAQWQIKHQLKKISTFQFDVLKIGLQCDTETLKTRIIKRSQRMLKDGLLAEIHKLGISWKKQSMATIGYQEWRSFLEGKETEKSCFEKWINNQLAYVKRQNLWFKKDTQIQWFDVSASAFTKKVEMLVEKWYSEKENEEN